MSTHHATTPPVREEHGEDTRALLVDLIAQQGPITAGDLAERLGLTPAAVRRHLTALLADQEVVVRPDPARDRGRGRPSKYYVLAPTAHQQMEADYDEVAQSALARIEELGGRDAVLGLAEDRLSGWIERIRPEIEASGPDVESRLTTLVDRLSELGYAASVRHLTVPITAATPGGHDGEAGSARPRTLLTAQLCQGHCPIQRIAELYPEFCAAETAAFADLLDVPVQRLSTLAAGAHACTTHIPLTEGKHDDQHH